MTALEFFIDPTTGKTIVSDGSFDMNTPNFSSPPRANIADLDAAVEANRKQRRGSFAEFVPSQYLSPLDIARKFHSEAAEEARKVGVLLPDDVQFTGNWIYAANSETGKNEQKHGYLAEIKQRSDGLIRPVYAFRTFKGGEETIQWNPDNLLWAEYNGGDSQPKHDPSEYKAKAAILEAEHTAKRAIRDEQDATGHAVVAMTAAKLFESLQDCTEHDYLTRKGIGSHGAKIAAKRQSGAVYDREKGEIVTDWICEVGDLIIPLYRDGKIVSLQRIPKKDGARKLFLKGGNVSGAYYLIKGTKEGQAFIAEGFATGATVCEATGRDVYIAFSAHNLKAVADAHLNIGAVAADGGKAGITEAEKTGLPFYAPPANDVGDDWNDYAQARSLSGVAMMLEGVAMAERSPPVVSNNLWDLADNAKPARYLVDGLIEEDAHGILGGASMTYKSFFALRLAHSVCSGRPFMGREVYKKGAVVYVCGEGQGAISLRGRALKIHLGGNLEHPLEIVPMGVSIGDPVSMKKLLDRIKPLNPVLVIFDTFASLSGGIEENSNSEVGNALNLVKDTCRAAGASSLIVHHFGKDAEKGFRGASAFVNNVDYAFIAKRYGGEGSFTASVSCHKMKDGEHFQDIQFKTELVYLGLYDQKGKEAASLVAEHDDNANYTKPLTQKEIMLRELNLLQSTAAITNTKDDPTWIQGGTWDKAAADAGVTNPRARRGELVVDKLVAKDGNKYRAIN